ncbi:DUF1682-domain-containing protein [Hysterangium stoloniferum]|nr:DUF1682-domain-containing protein [Hysterangium stoloniferum]
MLPFLFIVLSAARSVFAQGFAVNLLTGLSKITPAPIVQTEDWNGTEYRYNRIVFRPAQFKIEGAVLGVLCVYIVIWYLGKTQNYRRAMAWPVPPSLPSPIPTDISVQFSSPIPKSGTITQDGACDFFNYSTGRRGVRSLHTTVALLPRHDALSMIYDFGWTLYDLTYTPKDEISLNFTLQPTGSTPPFVWGIIKKDEMAQMRRSRWDLTFTKGSDSPLLPNDLCVFSEAADITESILKFSPSVPLVKVLQDSEVRKYFRSLIITDQPSERPLNGPIPLEDRTRHVILTLSSPSVSDAGVTLPIVNAAFALVDLLDAKLPLRPETKTKLKSRRDDVDDELKKESRKEKDEEQEESKRAAKRKAGEEKVSKLSASEQKKASCFQFLELLFRRLRLFPNFSLKKRSAKGLCENSKGRWSLGNNQ